MPTAPFAGTHERTRVEFDGRELIVNDRRLPLDQIERLARNVSRSTAQGSWNRLDCVVHLFANGEVTSVSFRGDASTEEWGPWRPLWDQLDLLVRDEIEPRLLERTIGAIASGSPVAVGTVWPKRRGRFTVTAESVQPRKWLSKPIAWRTITDISDDFRITTVDAHGKQRTHTLGLSSLEWDAWLVPLLWRHYGEPG